MKAAIIGNSIAGNIWCVHPANTFQAQVRKQALDRGIDITRFPWKGSTATGMGNLKVLQAYAASGLWPDILFYQGTFEQSGGTQATKISAAASATQQFLSLDATYSYAQVIRLGTDDDFEFVGLGATNGSSVRRGVLGTKAKAWPADTPIVRNTALGAWSTCLAWQAYIKQVAKFVSESPNPPILLFHDWWFSGGATVTAGMKALIDSLGYPNIGFVEFAKPDGTRLSASDDCTGPTAVITAIEEGAGTPALLTITCNNSKGVRHLRVGQYIALYDVSASTPPTSAAAWEYCKVSTVDPVAKTFTVASADRAKLGSTALTALAATDIVAALTCSSPDARERFDTLGAVNTLFGAYDTHPIDEAFYWMAYNAVEQIERIIEAQR
jgi:hypothetical protein